MAWDTGYLRSPLLPACPPPAPSPPETPSLSPTPLGILASQHPLLFGWSSRLPGPFQPPLSPSPRPRRGKEGRHTWGRKGPQLLCVHDCWPHPGHCPQRQGLDGTLTDHVGRDPSLEQASPLGPASPQVSCPELPTAASRKGRKAPPSGGLHSPAPSCPVRLTPTSCRPSPSARSPQPSPATVWDRLERCLLRWEQQEMGKAKGYSRSLWFWVPREPGPLLRLLCLLPLT